jgi:hypothetical protein
MTTNEILQRLADEIGKPLAQRADPAYWRYEHMERAAYYAPHRDAARVAYRQIRRGVPPVAALLQLKRTIRTGIELNFLNSLIRDIQAR